ncbi:MAG: ferric reductase-like transmembrane domain-containing protein [Desulfobulbaceae bacterium]|uniref:Ferric reductase-like transmembrane domain-containing protein n=1 Tax=Candidatus Desulfobia pelagia TaxID=2841692 RepID=A0A8J6TFR4_9BACT|nr:ferric reductase-like transmembrane domain-containing protein [Candidatus Desulfobia pelagia]
MDQKQNTSKRQITGSNVFLKILFVLVILGLLSGAASLPFLYKSTSIWYKLGFDRVLLLSGQVVGMLAATLVFLQIFYISHLPFLERVFGSQRLIAMHKFSAAIIACLVLIHPMLVFAPDGITKLSFEQKNWPEYVGAVLWIIIFTIFVTSRWRTSLKISFPSWRIFHRITVVAALVLVSVHMLFVSDTFVAGIPRYAVFCVLAVNAGLWLRLRLRR